MRGRKRRGLGPAFSQINVTPLVDVMLVLLIVFMIAAPLAVTMTTQEIHLDKSGEVREEASLFVTAGGVVRRGGFLGERVGDLAAWAAAALETTGEDALYLHGDASVPYGAVKVVIDRLMELRKEGKLPSLSRVFVVTPEGVDVPVTADRTDR